MMNKFLFRPALAGLLAVSLLAVLPSAAAAYCKGADLRKHVSPTDRAKIAAQAARIPFSEGIIWQATKGDQTIYVVGTHHAGDGRHRKVVADVNKYLKTADLLMLEMRTAEIEPQWDAVLEDPRMLILQRGPYVSQLLRKDLWDRLSLRMQIHGFTPETLNRVQPWFISGSVVHADCDPFSWNRSKGVDARLERFARTKRIPTMSLETVAESLRTISSEPIRNQVKLLELDMLSKAEFANMTTTLRNGYFEDRLTEAMLVNEAFMYRDLKVSRAEVSRLLRSRDKYILDERNKNWMPRILARKEKTIMVAVGAAHLPGDYGVLNLLHKHGYTLSPIKR